MIVAAPWRSGKKLAVERVAQRVGGWRVLEVEPERARMQFGEEAGHLLFRLTGEWATRGSLDDLYHMVRTRNFPPTILTIRLGWQLLTGPAYRLTRAILWQLAARRDLESKLRYVFLAESGEIAQHWESEARASYVSSISLIPLQVPHRVWELHVQEIERFLWDHPAGRGLRVE